MGKFDRKLTDPNNEIRLAAASMIHALWETKSINQLNLLKMQIDKSIEDLSFTGQTSSVEDRLIDKDSWGKNDNY